MLNLGSIKTLQKLVTTAGVPLKLAPHIVAATIAFNEVGATGDTITDSASKLLNAGFAVGDYILVSGTTNNNGVYKIKTIVAGTITVEDADDLVNEVAGASVTIIKVISYTDRTEIGYPVPNGVAVLIKAMVANGAGVITLGGSSAQALNSDTKHIKISAGESTPLQVSNLSAIWIDATVDGCGVEVLFES